MIPSGETGCGSGKVEFQFGYKDGEDVNLIKEWTKGCNGSLMPVDVNLSGLKGQTVQFVFTIKADGPATDDWAIWNSPRIEQ